MDPNVLSTLSGVQIINKKGLVELEKGTEKRIRTRKVPTEELTEVSLVEFSVDFLQKRLVNWILSVGH